MKRRLVDMFTLGSRVEWIDALRGASTIREVFDLANKAFCTRKEWGDDLVFSNAAARKWAGLMFPVEAHAEGAQVLGTRAPREEFLSMGLAAAKAAAEILLASIPAHANDDELRQAWAETSSRANAVVFSTIASFPHCKNLQPWFVFGPSTIRPDPELEWERAAEAPSWSRIEEFLLRPWEEAFETHYGPGGAESLCTSWNKGGEDPGDLGGLLLDTGAHCVVSGPAGGSVAVDKGARMLREAFRELAAVLGTPVEAVGVGIAGFELNMSSSATCSRDGFPMLAGYQMISKVMKFGHVPSHLGHEWTHALQAQVCRQGSDAQQQAFQKLLNATVADPESAFFAEAVREDALGYTKPGYYQNPTEMAARAAEAFYNGLGVAPAISHEKNWGLLPTGREAAELCVIYRELLDAVAREPEALASPRALEALRAGGAPRVPLSLGRWRQTKAEGPQGAEPRAGSASAPA